jgi:hypothetical protein
MESVTDPFINAWTDNAGFEIGDKCAWTGLFKQTTSTGTFAMQPEWDNRTSSCQPASTYVHGNIKLAANTTLCAAGSGSQVQLFSPCDTKFARTWASYPDGSLRAWKNTGKCIKPQNGSHTSGVALILARCNNSTIQQWTWSSSTGEWKNTASGKCMTAPTAASGTALVQDPCVGGATQKFSNV